MIEDANSDRLIKECEEKILSWRSAISSRELADAPTRFSKEQLEDPELLVVVGHSGESFFKTNIDETTESLLNRWKKTRNQQNRTASEVLSITYALHLHCL